MSYDVAYYDREWPATVREALAYHEAGHLVVQANYGHVTAYAWVADGRLKTKHERDLGEELQGTVMSALRLEHMIDLKTASMHKLYISGVQSNIGPLVSESFAPNYKLFGGLHLEYANFFTRESDEKLGTFFNGSTNDLKAAFNIMSRQYIFQGMPKLDAILYFTYHEVSRVREILSTYKPVIAAVAAELAEKRYLDGPAIQDILCKSGDDRLRDCYQKKATPNFFKEYDRIMTMLSTMSIEDERATLVA